LYAGTLRAQPDSLSSSAVAAQIEELYLFPIRGVNILGKTGLTVVRNLNVKRGQPMRTTTILALGLVAALMATTIISLPASAQPVYSNDFTLLSTSPGLTGSDGPTILPVWVGHYHGGFHWGLGLGEYYAPYDYNGYSPNYYGGGSGYYQEGNRTCVWNGYNYRCFKTHSY
jgi:hypothetical protein